MIAYYYAFTDKRYLDEIRNFLHKSEIFSTAIFAEKTFENVDQNRDSDKNEQSFLDQFQVV